jgi:hypothetical protein
VPYTLEYKKADGGIIVTYSGKLTDKEDQQCLKERVLLSEVILSSKKVGAFRYSISDCADVTDLDVSLDVLKHDANLANAVMEVNETVLMAAVTPNDHEFGMGRFWQASIGSSGERAEIFRTKEEANNWITQTLAQPEKAV